MVDMVLMGTHGLEKAEEVSQENRSFEELDYYAGPCHTARIQGTSGRSRSLCKGPEVGTRVVTFQ